MKRVFLAAAAAVLLFGSAAAKVLTAADIGQFKVGEATPAEVVSKLGRPLSTTKTSDGSEVLIYGSTHARAKPATFVPVVGLFAGGATSETTSAVFLFDPSGHLRNATFNTSNIDCANHVSGTTCEPAH